MSYQKPMIIYKDSLVWSHPPWNVIFDILYSPRERPSAYTGVRPLYQAIGCVENLEDLNVPRVVHQFNAISLIGQNDGGPVKLNWLGFLGFYFDNKEGGRHVLVL